MKNIFKGIITIMLFVGSAWSQKMDLYKTGYDFLYAGINNHFYIGKINTLNDAEIQCTNASAIRKGDTLIVKPHRSDSMVNVMFIGQENDTLLNQTFRTIFLPKPKLFIDGISDFDLIEDINGKLQAAAASNIAENLNYRVLSFEMVADSDHVYRSEQNSFTDEMRSYFGQLELGESLKIYAKVVGPDGKVINVATTFYKASRE